MSYLNTDLIKIKMIPVAIDEEYTESHYPPTIRTLSVNLETEYRDYGLAYTLESAGYNLINMDIGDYIDLQLSGSNDFLRIECNKITTTKKGYSVALYRPNFGQIARCTHYYSSSGVNNYLNLSIDSTEDAWRDVYIFECEYDDVTYYVPKNCNNRNEGATFNSTVSIPINPLAPGATISYGGTWTALLKNSVMAGLPNPYDKSGSGGDTPTEGTGTGGKQNVGQYNGMSVPLPDVPDVSFLTGSLIGAYVLNTSQVSALGSWLWTNPWDVETFKKLFGSPMEALISLTAYPFSITGGSSHYIQLGNLTTTASGAVLETQYHSVNCGSLSISPVWDNFLDCSPYTKVDLFLPYIGTVPLNIDDILQINNGSLGGATLSVKYVIDIMTGSCCALVSVNNALLSQHNGNCALTIPTSASNWNSVYTGILGLVSDVANVAGSVAVGNPVGVVGGAISAANDALNMKPHYVTSGSANGNAGFMGYQKPYVIISRAWASLPDDFGAYHGYTSNITSTLSSLAGTGFTQVDTIHLQGIDCTSAELDEIESLLKDGVVL